MDERSRDHENIVETSDMDGDDESRPMLFFHFYLFSYNFGIDYKIKSH